jgi:transcriptional regulator with XRE-family HTH domain
LFQKQSFVLNLWTTEMVESKQSRTFMAQRLGKIIAAQRKALGWTQSDLAERIGVETETVSRFERGATLPSLPTLEKLSHSLRVGIGKLLTETSIQPDDQVSMLSAWLADLGDGDRDFVLDLIRRTCNHLREHGAA